MTAAFRAGAGQQVVLVEKGAQLGGMVNKLYKKIPRVLHQQAADRRHGHRETVAEVEATRHQVYKSTTVTKTDGQPGL